MSQLVKESSIFIIYYDVKLFLFKIKKKKKLKRKKKQSHRDKSSNDYHWYIWKNIDIFK